MRFLVAVLASVGASLSAPVSADNNVLVGTGLGAAMGAVVGHQIDHDNGAWVGGAVGAVTGAAIASSNHSTRYVAADPYYGSYNSYEYVPRNTVRRDIYVVEPNYYHRLPPPRPPVNVIYVDGHHGRHGHHHNHYDRQHHGRGQTVVIVR
ncbi:MAG: glycine zipper 2TM domain-containing protein [Pseudomonadota bacterium]